MQGNSKVVERRRGDVGRTHLVSVHTKAEGHCKEQRRGRAVAGSIKSVRIKRDCVVAERPTVREETSAGH